MILRQILRQRHRFIRQLSTNYESSYDIVIDRLTAKDKNADYTKNESWNSLIDELIENRLPCYSDRLRKSVQRSINYRNDIHRGNQKSLDLMNDLKTQLESTLTEDNIDVFILKVLRDLGDPELSLQYLKFIQLSKPTTLYHKLLVLESVGQSPTPIKNPTTEREIVSIAEETHNYISDLDMHNNIFFIIGAYSNTSKWMEKALPMYFSSNVSSPKEDLEERYTRSSVKAGEHLALRILHEKGPTSDFWSIINHTNFITTNFQLRYVQVEDVQRCHDRVYIEYIKSAKDLKDINLLFEFLRKHWVLLSWNVARAIKEKLDTEFKIKIEVVNRGTCKACSTHLQSDRFNPSDLEKLRDVVYERCLEKNDIYLSSLPEEVKRFDEFCNKLSKFDVVVDGLNVALSHLPKFKDGSFTKAKIGHKMLSVQSKNIVGILKTLRSRGMKDIVLIHRDGIRRLPDYDAISKLCHIYIARRDSQDDPFMLLAALSSGLGTLLVSNDRLRQHNYLLVDPQLQSLFTRWQLAHQCHHKIWVTPDKANGRMNYRYVVTHPLSFEIRPQQSEGSWHLPLLHKYDEEKGHLSVPKYWLCLNRNDS